VYFLGENEKFKRGITLENVIAAFLFAIAHMKWSLFPLTFEANFPQTYMKYTTLDSCVKPSKSDKTSYFKT
jgi:hypothetical protein